MNEVIKKDPLDAGRIMTTQEVKHSTHRSSDLQNNKNI